MKKPIPSLKKVTGNFVVPHPAHFYDDSDADAESIIESHTQGGTHEAEDILTAAQAGIDLELHKIDPERPKKSHKPGEMPL